MSSPRAPPPPSLSGAAISNAGLVVHVGNGYERMILSDQKICDDVLATVPKLQAAAHCDTFGRRWKQRKRKNGVDMFELIPGGGGDPNDDLDVAHALVAKTEIRCHLNEVLNVLVNQQSSDYESSMRALCGRKFKRGQVLFQQRRKFALPRTRSSSNTSSTSSNISTMKATVPQDGLVGVQLATLRPKLRVKIHSKHKRTQRLCLASCTQQFPSKDRAIHVIKTIPKDAHDQIVPSQDRTALRRELDHIAVGFDIQSKHGGGYGAIHHSTRIFLHAYASTVPPAQYGRYGKVQPGAFAAADLARRRESIMNPEAKHVMELLTKSLRQFESVIRRRRFGFQSFIYFPTFSQDPISTLNSNSSNCTICHKNFSFFRRDFFCQLCGCMVCKDCSQLYEVEARIGDIRKNRCCIQCVVRVDACVFDDEELLPALSGPVVVDADEASWYASSSETEYDHCTNDNDNDDTVSLGSNASSSLDEITDNLFSNDPSQRSQALELLAQLVGSSSPTTQTQSQMPRSKTLRVTNGGAQTKTQANAAKPRGEIKKQVFRDVENHLSQSLRASRAQYASADNCVVYDGERDYVYNYDATGTAANPNVPMAPVPESRKEATRLKYIQESGVLEEKYDRSALDMLAQIAAKKLNCPIGFVSVVDESQFRAIGTYNLPEVAYTLPRDENLCVHSVYAEKPMIVKNPQRDMRFAQMGCIKDLGVKFYAGFPVCAPDGSVVASLCTGDLVPHNHITTKEYATMEALSKLAADLIVPRAKPQAQAQVPAPARVTRQLSQPHDHFYHPQQQQQQYGQSQLTRGHSASSLQYSSKSNGNGNGNGMQRAEPYVIY